MGIGAGVTLAVVGAILTFAVRVSPSGINLNVVGLILMIAGGSVIALDLRVLGPRRRSVMSRSETTTDPHAQRTVRRTVRDEDRY